MRSYPLILAAVCLGAGAAGVAQTPGRGRVQGGRCGSEVAGRVAVGGQARASNR